MADTVTISAGFSTSIHNIRPHLSRSESCVYPRCQSLWHLGYDHTQARYTRVHIIHSEVALTWHRMPRHSVGHSRTKSQRVARTNKPH